jgi:hypothetical protein
MSQDCSLTRLTEREVFFAQEQQPGQMLQLDWTYARELRVASPAKEYLPPRPGCLQSKPFNYSEFINGIGLSRKSLFARPLVLSGARGRRRPSSSRLSA